MAIMGWSDRRMLRRYQHVIDELRVTASRGLSALLWDEPKKPKKAKAKKAKKLKQGKKKSVDGVSEGFATDLATEHAGAKIIPFPVSA